MSKTIIIIIIIISDLIIKLQQLDFFIRPSRDGSYYVIGYGGW